MRKPPSGSGSDKAKSRGTTNRSGKLPETESRHQRLRRYRSRAFETGRRSIMGQLVQHGHKLGRMTKNPPIRNPGKDIASDAEVRAAKRGANSTRKKNVKNIKGEISEKRAAAGAGKPERRVLGVRIARASRPGANPHLHPTLLAQLPKRRRNALQKRSGSQGRR